MAKSVKSLVDGERVTEKCEKGGGKRKGEHARKGEEYTRQDRALGPLQLGLAAGLYDEFRTVLELFWKFFVGVGGGQEGGGVCMGGDRVCMGDHNDVSPTFVDDEPFPGIFNW